MTEYSTLHINNFRLRCTASWDPSDVGCYGDGPRGESKFEAIENACEDGWQNINGHWCCPDHVEVYRDVEKDLS